MLRSQCKLFLVHGPQSIRSHMWSIYFSAPNTYKAVILSDFKGDRCIMPQFGSGPDEDGQGNPGSGYLTQAQYRDILKHAEGLGIRIVPEIVAPSHSAAAIQAMRVRNNDTTLLTDPEQPADESQSIQGSVAILFTT